jgi:hypothetical protein
MPLVVGAEGGWLGQAFLKRQVARLAATTRIPADQANA